MKLAYLTFFILFATASTAQDDQQQYNFFKGQKTFIKNPFELRDPFKRPNFKKKKSAEKKYGGRVVDDQFTNMPEIGKIDVNDLKVVGIVLGKNRRAVAKIGKQTYVLKEGMMLGEDQAELKAILPGGIVLVEKFKNVYDQDEYLETIIPVSAE